MTDITRLKKIINIPLYKKIETINIYNKEQDVQELDIDTISGHLGKESLVNFLYSRITKLRKK
jgi:hypothetical protein